ncbi:GPO family capsid scaffolding protein [Sodalis endosymbiont of Spalangia cameroni]|uniref:GPO family capsid scaffolding protein n=1 Tax=Sodalis praecaptivus TaxID=1239307 RepID=UPI0031F9AA36
MASAAKPARKKFRVAVSGSTVDGREIRPDHLRDAAAHYSPDVYGARINVEHYISPVPGSEFGAMGDVTALSTEEISDGPLAGRTALYAEIAPSERMRQLTEEGKKIYSSIELHPQFALNGKAYVVGLAMTDTPASLGTERLKFAAQQRAQVMTFNNQLGDAPLFTDAIEAELIELAEQRSDEGKQWFGRIMAMIGAARHSDTAQFSQVRDAVEQVAQSHADLVDRVAALTQQHTRDRRQITTLNNELTALRGQLQQQDGDPVSRFAVTGEACATLSDY